MGGMEREERFGHGGRQGEEHAEFAKSVWKEILAHGAGVWGAAAGDALALPCDLEVGPELPSGAVRESMGEHGAGRNCWWLFKKNM